MSDDIRDLIVVGAGPAGLAVAIAAHQAGLDYEVIEKGVLVNSIFHFPRAMTFFTTPDLLEIGGLPFVTPYEKPTQWEALRYYRRVADAFALRIALGEELREIAPDGDALRLVTRLTRWGDERVRRARNVALATGYYDHPNRLGVPGEDLPHVAHYYDEPHPFYRKRGGGGGRKEFGRHRRPRAVPSGGQGHARPPPGGSGRLHQVLDPAGHREPDQGRGSGALVSRPGWSRSGATTSSSRGRRAAARSQPKPSSC